MVVGERIRGELPAAFITAPLRDRRDECSGDPLAALLRQNKEAFEERDGPGVGAVDVVGAQFRLRETDRAAAGMGEEVRIPPIVRQVLGDFAELLLVRTVRKKKLSQRDPVCRIGRGAASNYRNQNSISEVSTSKRAACVFFAGRWYHWPGP